MDVNSVLEHLERLQSTLQPGDPFPTQRELLERFDASERTMRAALDELNRQGKIVRRQGSGSFVAELDSQKNGRPLTGGYKTSSVEFQSQTIVAISEPDGSIFERALQLLAKHPDANEFSINCRLMKSADADKFVLPSEFQQPIGYVVFGRSFSCMAQKLQTAGHRVVLIGSPAVDETIGVPNVYCDHNEGGFLITHHLLELGHRRFLFQGGNDFKQHSRWIGALRAFKEVKVGVEHEFLADDKWSVWSKNPVLVHEFFTQANAPTAFVAWNDERAVQALTLLNRAGLRVPQDVSLVGYDDLPISATLHPALSTVDSSIERQLHAALRLLIQPQVASPHHTVVVLPTFVRRDSSAPVIQ